MITKRKKTEILHSYLRIFLIHVITYKYNITQIKFSNSNNNLFKENANLSN